MQNKTRAPLQGIDISQDSVKVACNYYLQPTSSETLVDTSQMPYIFSAGVNSTHTEQGPRFNLDSGKRILQRPVCQRKHLGGISKFSMWDLKQRLGQKSIHCGEDNKANLGINTNLKRIIHRVWVHCIYSVEYV